MTDREQNHLDFLTDMVDRCYTPGQYHTTSEQDAEIEMREAQRMTANEWIHSGAPVPTERPEVIAEDEFRAKFNLAARRL